MHRSTNYTTHLRNFESLLTFELISAMNVKFSQVVDEFAYMYVGSSLEYHIPLYRFKFGFKLSQAKVLLLVP